MFQQAYPISNVSAVIFQQAYSISNVSASLSYFGRWFSCFTETLREKCPDTEFFLVRIFLFLD